MQCPHHGKGEQKDDNVDDHVTNGNCDPIGKVGVAIAWLITVPVVAEGPAREKYGEYAGDPPARCHSHRHLGSKTVSRFGKYSKIKEKNSQLDQQNACDPEELDC